MTTVATPITHQPTMPFTHELTLPLALPTSPQRRAMPDQSSALYFVRHGATEPNTLGLRCGGDLDLPMTELGREQARMTAERIRALKIDIGLIVCSPLKRTRLHADIVSRMLGGVPIIIDPLLAERHMGEWNLRSVPITEKLLVRGMAPPGGETEQAFVARVSGAFDRLPALLPLNPLVVSSKAVARVLNLRLGGSGRLTLENGEMVQFMMQPPASPIANERIPR